MTQRELTFTQWGFAFWFVNLNFQGVDILPDFLGIAFLACLLTVVQHIRNNLT